MDPVRFRALTEPDTSEAGACGDTVSAHLIALDLRFAYYLDSPQCHVSLSLWSARPWNSRYVPADWPTKQKRQHLDLAEVQEYADEFRSVLSRAIGLLKRHLAEADLRVYRRKQVLPIFWVAVPDAVGADHQRKRSDLRQHLARIFLDLGDPADCVVTRSVVNGQFDVLRRFRRGLRMDESAIKDKHLSLSRAHYLIVPGPLSTSVRTDARFRAFEGQEDQTAGVITKLTDLEARAASDLYSVHRDLQIWRNHLDVHDQVVERGAFLWAGLSTHLVRRRRALRRVHRATELLHQILLQGVGDLAHLSNRIRDCVGQVEAAADQLRTNYDDQLTERHDEQSAGLRGALARIGLFERVTQHGHQTLQEANRVKTIYDDLLRTIGYAFDEWRVRESDVVQRLSAALGAFLALIGIVTVLDATIDIKPDPGSDGTTVLGGPDAVQTAAVWTSWGIGGALVVAITGMIVVWRLAGRLGSRDFRRRYAGRRQDRRVGGAWRLIKDISTDGLNEDVARRSKKGQASIDKDDDLASRFAELWDAACALDGTVRDEVLSKDIAAQSRRIEQWGLLSLLMTERARRMHQHFLPRLTCLYRTCTRLPGAIPIPPGRSTEEVHTMIDFNEFALVFKPLRLSWNDAYQLELWLIHRQPQTARHLLGILAGIGLHSKTSPQTAKDIICRIRHELDESPMSRYPDCYNEDLRRYFSHDGHLDWHETSRDDALQITSRKDKSEICHSRRYAACTRNAGSCSAPPRTTPARW